VIEMMMAGASAVEIGSAVYNDVKIFETIKADLYRKDGLTQEQIIGSAHE
jgi:dihydroorotate dehydrogenase (NAD+) catalytic subunit